MTVTEYVDLASGVRALIVPGRPVAPQPRLWLNSPAVVLRSDPDGAPDDAPTVGSRAWLWGDDEDWRFDADSGVLTSLVWNLPEVNIQADSGFRDWDHSATVTGTLRLDRPEDFGRQPARVRWCDPNGAELVGLYSPEIAAGLPRCRVALADRTHLLIAGETVVGWSIKDPARYITGEAVPPTAWDTEPDVRLPPLLAAFFAQVTEENVDKLEDGDTDVRSDLQRLASSLEAVATDGEPRAAEVLTKVRQVLEDFAS